MPTSPRTRCVSIPPLGRPPRGPWRRHSWRRRDVLWAVMALGLVLCAPATAQENGSGDAPEPEAKAATEGPAAELPPVFVPKEKIPPDSVISFPADI